MFSFFFIPFHYTLHTRIDSLYKRLSWVFIYLIPVILSPLFINNNYFNLQNILTSILGVFLIYNFYEIGYITNDTETIKNESSPTIRLSLKEISFYRKNKKIIYVSRLFLGIFFSIGIILLSDTYLFIYTSLLILFFFIIYNNIRNTYNLIIHFILSSLRFCTIPLIFLPYQNFIEIYIYMILLFPLLNTLERTQEKKFNLKILFNPTFTNSKNGRYKYYLFLIILSFSTLLIKIIFELPYIYSSVVFLFYSIYFFAYRYFSYKIYLTYKIKI